MLKLQLRTANYEKLPLKRSVDYQSCPRGQDEEEERRRHFIWASALDIEIADRMSREQTMQSTNFENHVS